MSRKDLTAAPIPDVSSTSAPAVPQRAALRGVLLCMITFGVSTLISVAPLERLAGKTFLLSLPTNPVLLWWGSWLPYNQHPRASMITTNDLAFLILMALAFVIYALGALFIRRQPQQADYRRLLRLVWLGCSVIGLIYVFTPALLSRDLFVYAGYGRLVVAHHANPYFTMASAYPRDPIIGYDDWKNATSAYGPAWLAICSFWSLLLGASPLGYFLAFRLFALGAHLLNALLVAAILRGLGRPSRTVALGAYLYALNPLVLMESGLGAHNDTFMVSLILLGILLCMRAERRMFAQPSAYLPPVVAFTLAALVKFTAAPVIFFYVVLLAYHALHSRQSGSPLPALRPAAYGKMCMTVAVGGLLAIALYAPFWLGHSIRDIMSSFSTPPSAYFAENSILRAIFNAGLPTSTSWTYLPLSILSQHSVWNALNLMIVLCFVGLGAIWLWRAPGLHTLMLASLAAMGALLIFTPWFFAWYVTWLVALASACLAPGTRNYGRALVAFAFTYSLTALSTYLFNGYPPIGAWSGLGLLMMYVPPIIAFLLFATRRNVPGP